MPYQIMYDNAGEVSVCELTWDTVETGEYSTHSGHMTQYGPLLNTQEQVDAALADLRGPDIFAVFVDRAAGTAFYSRENNCSGNWRGSKYAPAVCVYEYASEALAQLEVENWEKHFQVVKRKQRRD